MLNDDMPIGRILTRREAILLLGAAGMSLAGAQVDVWHCNAGGLYSDESANHTVGRKFLRGYQLTDSNGAVEFLTIYPGWYSGRTAHIHFKIRTFSDSRQTSEFTSQLFFSDPLNDQVFAQSPYNTRGARNTRNSNDNIYNSQMQLSPTQQDDGYEASFDIGLDLG